MQLVSSHHKPSHNAHSFCFLFICRRRASQPVPPLLSCNVWGLSQTQSRRLSCAVAHGTATSTRTKTFLLDVWLPAQRAVGSEVYAIITARRPTAWKANQIWRRQRQRRRGQRTSCAYYKQERQVVRYVAFCIALAAFLLIHEECMASQKDRGLDSKLCKPDVCKTIVCLLGAASS